MDVNESEDPEGLRVFYYLVQDLKALVFSLISLHFKVSGGFDWTLSFSWLMNDRSNRSEYIGEEGRRQAARPLHNDDAHRRKSARWIATVTGGKNGIMSSCPPDHHSDAKTYIAPTL